MKAPVKSNPNWLNLKAVNASKAGTQKSTAAVAKNTVNYSRLTPTEYKANQDSLYLYNTQKEFNNQFKKYFTKAEGPSSDMPDIKQLFQKAKTATPSKTEAIEKAKQDNKKEAATSLVTDIKNNFLTNPKVKEKEIIKIYRTGINNYNNQRFPKGTGTIEKQKLDRALKNENNSFVQDSYEVSQTLSSGSFTPNSKANFKFDMLGSDSKDRKHGVEKVKNKDVVKNTEYSEATIGEFNDGETPFNTKNNKQLARRYFIPHYDVVNDKIKPVSYEKYYQSLSATELKPVDKSSEEFNDMKRYYSKDPKKNIGNYLNKNFKTKSESGGDSDPVHDPSSFSYDDINQANSKLPIYKKPREVIYDDKETPVSKSPTKIPIKAVLKKPIEETKRETYTPPIEIQSRGIVTQQPTLPLKEPTPFNIIPIKPTFVKEDISKGDTIAPTKTKSKVGLLDFLNENKKTERVSFGSRGNKPTNQHKGGWYNTRR